MTAGDGAAPDRPRCDVVPWPTAAQRAARAAAGPARRRRFAFVGEAASGTGAAVGAPPPISLAPAPGPVPAKPPVPSVEAPVVPLPARPRVEPDDDSLFGLTRRSQGRLGSRLFIAFFVFVFLLIAAQLVVVLLGG